MFVNEKFYINKYFMQLDENGNMKEDEISKYIKERFAILNFPEDTVDKIIDTCMKEAKNLTRNTDQSTTTCNPVSLKLSHCIFKQVNLYIEVIFKSSSISLFFG